MVIQTCTIWILLPYRGTLRINTKVQACAKCGCSETLSSLSATKGNSFTFPHGYYLILLVDSSPHLFKLKISILISRAIQQNKSCLYQPRAAVAGDSAVRKALGWLPIPLLFGRICQRYFLSLNSFAASPAKGTLSQ